MWLVLLHMHFQKLPITPSQAEAVCDAPMMGIIYTEGILLRLSHLPHFHCPQKFTQKLHTGN